MSPEKEGEKTVRKKKKKGREERRGKKKGEEEEEEVQEMTGDGQMLAHLMLKEHEV